MIILALRGENFMKFRRLRLESLPRRGLLGLEGENEAGKSTIGELIQFALFGKTLSSTEGSVLDLIHWDQDHCTVELDFEVTEAGTQTRYRIWREIDRYGTNFARLLNLTERTEVASGIMQAQEQMDRLIRFEFNDFCRSFYLSEEAVPRSPEEMRDFLDRIIGADILARAREEVRAEVSEHEEVFVRLQGEIKRNRQHIEKYLPNIARIPELEQARNEHQERLRDLKAKLEENARGIESGETEVKEREKQRDRVRALGKTPARSVAGVIGKMLEAYPRAALAEGDSRSARLAPVRERLEKVERLAAAFQALLRGIEVEIAVMKRFLHGDDEASLPAREQRAAAGRDRSARRRSRAVAVGIAASIVTLVVAFLFVLDYFEAAPTSHLVERPSLFTGGLMVLAPLGLVLAVLAFVRAASHLGVVRSLETELEEIAIGRRVEQEKLAQLEGFMAKDATFDEVLGAVEGCLRPALEPLLVEYRARLNDCTAPDLLFDAALGVSAEIEHSVVQELRGELKELRKEGQRLAELQKRDLSKRDRCESEIREYQKQDGKREQLEQESAALKKEADGVREEIDTRHLLVGLLEETVDSMRHRAGPNLGKSMRRLLSNLTNGRYQDMQITPDFRIRLFTSEKSDFLAPHELSGGTYEGLAFGFRLVFSQAFIKAVTRAPQFLFLDEPFKAMDRNRIHQTLRILTRLSPEIAQIFVLVPGIDPADRHIFDEIVLTRVGVAELVHEFQSGPPGSARPQGLEPEREPALGTPPAGGEGTAREPDPYFGGGA